MEMEGDVNKLKRRSTSETGKSSKSSKPKKSKNHSKKKKKRDSRNEPLDDSNLSSSDSSNVPVSKDKKKEKKWKKSKKQKKKKNDKKRNDSEEEEQVSIGPDITLISANARAPMTKEEYEKQQNTLHRVTDPETGRQRLIRGTGEIVEEIVSKERHQEINRQATRGDASFFHNHSLAVAKMSSRK